MDTIAQVENLLLYDGDCAFCNRSVQFILDHERQKGLFFASLQSPMGQKILIANNLPTNYTESLIYSFKSNIHIKSKAAFLLAGQLKWPFRAIAVFRFLPRPFTDAVYDVVAKNRYKIVSQSQACVIYDAETKARFVE